MIVMIALLYYHSSMISLSITLWFYDSARRLLRGSVSDAFSLVVTMIDLVVVVPSYTCTNQMASKEAIRFTVVFSKQRLLIYCDPFTIERISMHQMINENEKI